jgi:hypothetical protein
MDKGTSALHELLLQLKNLIFIQKHAEEKPMCNKHFYYEEKHITLSFNNLILKLL